MAQSAPVAERTQQVDLRECITGLIYSFPDGKQDLFRCTWPNAGPKVRGDPVKLQSVFENLFLNSIQAGATQIGVRASAMKEAVVVSVEDNGAGCDRETAKRLFTPFFTTKKDQHGAGLGLAVSKNIVESHGGSISAQLKNLSGNGSSGLVFTVTLPVIGPQAIGN
jgi:two-component system C4-dicarboxylate transport sensor histidine kinase DctB